MEREPFLLGFVFRRGRVMLGVNGLLYIPNCISQEEQDRLIQIIDRKQWEDAQGRRAQQYGHVYKSLAGAFRRPRTVGELPDWLKQLALQMQTDGIFAELPNQVIINEYQPGQGIGNHIDATPTFGEVVVSLSLLSSAIMDFMRLRDHVEVVLEPGSVVVIRGEARYEWTHGIAGRGEDRIGEEAVPRSRRVSITFRTVGSHT